MGSNMTRVLPSMTLGHLLHHDIVGEALFPEICVQRQCCSDHLRVLIEGYFTGKALPGQSERANGLKYMYSTLDIDTRRLNVRNRPRLFITVQLPYINCLTPNL